MGSEKIQAPITIINGEPIVFDEEEELTEEDAKNRGLSQTLVKTGTPHANEKGRQQPKNTKKNKTKVKGSKKPKIKIRKKK